MYFTDDNEEQFNEQKSKPEACQSEQKVTKAELDAKKNDSLELKRRLEESEKNLRVLRAELAIKEAVIDYSGENSALKKTLGETESKLNRAKAEFDKKYGKIEKDLGEQKKALTESQAKLKVKEEESSNKSIEIDRLTEKLKRKKLSKQIIKDKLEKSDKSNAKLTNTLNEKEAQFEKLRRDYKESQDKLKNVTKEIKKAKESVIQRQEQDSEGYKLKFEESQKEVKELKIRIEDIQKDKETIEQINNSTKSELETSLKLKEKESQQRIAELSLSNSTLSQEKENLQQVKENLQQQLNAQDNSRNNQQVEMQQKQQKDKKKQEIEDIKKQKMLQSQSYQEYLKNVGIPSVNNNIQSILRMTQGVQGYVLQQGLVTADSISQSGVLRNTTNEPALIEKRKQQIEQSLINYTEDSIMIDVIIDNKALSCEEWIKRFYSQFKPIQISTESVSHLPNVWYELRGISQQFLAMFQQYDIKGYTQVQDDGNSIFRSWMIAYLIAKFIEYKEDKKKLKVFLDLLLRIPVCRLTQLHEQDSPAPNIFAEFVTRYLETKVTEWLSAQNSLLAFKQSLENSFTDFALVTYCKSMIIQGSNIIRQSPRSFIQQINEDQICYEVSQISPKEFNDYMKHMIYLTLSNFFQCTLQIFSPLLSLKPDIYSFEFPFKELDSYKVLHLCDSGQTIQTISILSKSDKFIILHSSQMLFQLQPITPSQPFSQQPQLNTGHKVNDPYSQNRMNYQQQGQNQVFAMSQQSNIHPQQQDAQYASNINPTHNYSAQYSPQDFQGNQEHSQQNPHLHHSNSYPNSANENVHYQHPSPMNNWQNQQQNQGFQQNQGYQQANKNGRQYYQN